MQVECFPAGLCFALQFNVGKVYAVIQNTFAKHRAEKGVPTGYNMYVQFI